MFSQHTPLIPVIAVLPVTDAPQTLAMYETVSAGFRDAGFPDERIVSSIVALESFIFGSAYDVTAPADILIPEPWRRRRRASRVPSGAWPSRGTNARPTSPSALALRH